MCIQCDFVQNTTLTKTSHDQSSASTWMCLCGAIGQRARLLTERMVVRAHPGTRTLCSCTNTLTGNYLNLAVKQDSCPKTQSHDVLWLLGEFERRLAAVLSCRVASGAISSLMKKTNFFIVSPSTRVFLAFYYRRDNSKWLISFIQKKFWMHGSCICLPWYISLSICVNLKHTNYWMSHVDGLFVFLNLVTSAVASISSSSFMVALAFFCRYRKLTVYL